jgi:predicted hydrocarbon binding protein
MGRSRRRVDARLPLVLLQAVQQQDAPPELLPDEDAGSMFPNRLGLSDVIEGQVQQFRRLARLHRRVEADKVEALLELIARRRDAAVIFDVAGRELARMHFSGPLAAFRRMARKLPRRLRRRAAVRALRKANAAFLVAREHVVKAKPFEIRAEDALTARVGGYGAACKLYTSLAAGLLELSGLGTETVVHRECQRRGDTRCIWRVEADGS